MVVQRLTGEFGPTNHPDGLEVREGTDLFRHVLVALVRMEEGTKFHVVEKARKGPSELGGMVPDKGFTASGGAERPSHLDM